MNNIQIIILAAGKSTRMKSDTPKALITLKDKPFINHILDTVKSLDSKIKPIIVVGHKKEDIKKALGKEHIYAEQAEQLGTGHAVMSAKNFVNASCDTVLVIYADQPMTSKETLKRIIEKYTEKKPAITLATVTVPDFEDWRKKMYTDYGRIIRGADGSVTKIVEFKDANEEEKKVKELNPALYAFDTEWLWKNIDKIKNENAKKEFYLTDMVKMACEQKMKIETVPVENIIEAIQPNSPEELEVLEKISV